jgi:hypothetical protein
MRLIEAVALLATVFAVSANAQEAKFKKADLVGSWVLSSIVNITPDGRRVTTFGQNDGSLMFGSDGRFSQILTRGDLPKVASNNRDTATSDETKAIIQGSLAMFGTYSFDEASGALTIKIERSTFPNWNGTEQKRQITGLSSSDLKWQNSGASIGGSTENVWHHAK